MFTGFSALLLIGCTYGHTVQKTERSLQVLGLKSHHEVSRGETWLLASTSSVLLAYPQSAVPDQMPRLRHALAGAWERAAQRHFQRTVMAPMEAQDYDLFAIARAGGYQLVLEMVVISPMEDASSPVKWHRDRGQNRNTPGRAHLTLLVNVYDVQTHRRLDSVRIESEGPLWGGPESSSTELVATALTALVQPLTDPVTTWVY